MTRTVASSDFGALFQTIASLASPVQGARSRYGHGVAAGPRPRRPLAQAASVLLTWSGRARQRRQLAQFDDHLLRDIGITRADAIAEAAKPFWRD